jgi:hypothetical protein
MLSLIASDISEQKQVEVQDVPSDADVQEVLDAIVRQMELPANDVEGRPLVYQALLPREGRHLRGDEKVGEALATGDRIVVQPNIEAGGF